MPTNARREASEEGDRPPCRWCRLKRWTCWTELWLRGSRFISLGIATDIDAFAVVYAGTDTRIGQLMHLRPSIRNRNIPEISEPHLKRTEPLESGNRSNETIPVLRGTFVQTRYSRPARRTYVAPPVVKRQTLATLSRLLAFALLTFFALLSLAGIASAQEPTTSPTPPTPTASATPTAPVPDNAVPVSGNLNNGGTRLEGVTVRALDSSGTEVATGESASNGRWELAVAPAPTPSRSLPTHFPTGSVCKPLSNARWWPAARTP